MVEFIKDYKREDVDYVIDEDGIKEWVPLSKRFHLEFKEILFKLEYLFNTGYYVETEENYRLSCEFRAESFEIAKGLYDKFSKGDLINGRYKLNQASYLIYKEKNHQLISYLETLTGLLSSINFIGSINNDSFYDIILNGEINGSETLFFERENDKYKVTITKKNNEEE